MSIAEYIQIGLLLSAVIALFINAKQFIKQNKLLGFQVVRDFIDLYNKAILPITNDDVEILKLFPDDFIDEEYYKRIKDNDALIKRYLYKFHNYEFLAMLYASKKFEILDSIGFQNWIENWTNDYVSYDTDEYKTINDYHRPYYPDYAVYVDTLMGNRNTSCKQDH